MSKFIKVTPLKFKDNAIEYEQYEPNAWINADHIMLINIWEANTMLTMDSKLDGDIDSDIKFSEAYPNVCMVKETPEEILKLIEEK